MIARLGLQTLLYRRLRWILAGLALTALALIAAIALLGLSGWFIIASAMAGLGLIVLMDIFTPGAGIRLAALTRTVARYGERLVTHELTFRLLADLRLKAFGRLVRRPPALIAGLRRGDTLQRLTRDIDSLDQLFIGIIGPSLAALGLTLIAILLLALIDWPLALASAGALLVLAPLISGLIHQAGRQPSRRAGQLLPDLRVLASDGIDALNELRALDRTRAQAEQIRATSARLGRVQKALGRLDAIGQGSITLSHLLALWFGLVLGLQLLEAESISGPVLGLVVLGLIGLGEAWQNLPTAWRRLGQCQAAAERLQPLIGSTLAEENLSTLAWPERPDIRFEHIDFRYSAHSPPVLVDFSLSLAHGETLILRGPSGIGKTTLARLLLEECQPQAGRILIGGQPLADLGEADKLARIGYLPQQPIVFADTLAANLRLADPQASDEALIAVLDEVGLSPLLEALPLGLDSWIEEQGRNLSGGQLRRLAVARLMLSNPDIVILDEPTASLDPASAESLASRLQAWLRDRTALIISHDAVIGGDRQLKPGSTSNGILQLSEY